MLQRWGKDPPNAGNFTGLSSAVLLLTKVSRLPEYSKVSLRELHTHFCIPLAQMISKRQPQSAKDFPKKVHDDHQDSAQEISHYSTNAFNCRITTGLCNLWHPIPSPVSRSTIFILKNRNKIQLICKPRVRWSLLRMYKCYGWGRADQPVSYKLPDEW